MSFDFESFITGGTPKRKGKGKGKKTKRKQAPPELTIQDMIGNFRGNMGALKGSPAGQMIGKKIGTHLKKRRIRNAKVAVFRQNIRNIKKPQKQFKKIEPDDFFVDHKGV